MGDRTEPVDMAQLLGAINALGDRLTRLEQPQPQQRGLARGPNADRVDEEVADSEDEPIPEHNRNRRGQHNRDGGRREERARDGGKDIKLTAPTFAGKVNPDAYLDWEKRMEHIFEYYNYSEARKVSLAAAQLTENALAWWDRDVSERRRHRHGQISTWEDMRFVMRKRYVPAYYHRDLQKKFRKLTQGSKSVEEYFEEFETIKNRLEVEDSEETLMAQFLDGLQDRIARKVERQTYHDLEELLHLAVQAEQHIKRKTTTTTRSSTRWNQQPH